MSETDLHIQTKDGEEVLVSATSLSKTEPEGETTDGIDRVISAMMEEFDGRVIVKNPD